MIIFILIVLFVTCAYMYNKGMFDEWFVMVNLGLFIILALSVLISGVISLETYGIEDKRDAIEFSIKTLKTDGTFEHLSLDAEVLEFNKSLAIYKKYNKTWLYGFCINDVVDELEFISVDR